jgi:uncharacterized protein YndB with AHSA1/START domain
VAKVITLKISAHSSRPPEQVFAHLVDLERHEWSPGDYRVEDCSHAELEVGATWTAYGFRPPSTPDCRTEATVEELVPGERLTLVTQSDDGEQRYAYELTPEKGGTRVDREMQMPRPGGAQGFAVDRVAKLIIKPAMQKHLEEFLVQVDQG